MFILYFLAFIIGIAVILYERRAKKRDAKILHEFIESVKNEAVESKEKIKKLQSMLLLNGYRILKSEQERLQACRKRFMVGWFLVWFSLGGVGSFIYLIYFFFFKECESVDIELK